MSLSTLFLCILMLCASGTRTLAADTALEAVRVIGQRSETGSDAQNNDGRALSIPLFSDEGKTLTESLSKIPSVQIAPDSSDKMPSFSVRGAEPGQTRIFLEGISLTDAEFNASYFQFLPTGAIRQIGLFEDEVPASFLSDGTGSGLNLEIQPDSADSLWEFYSRIGAFKNLRVGTRGNISRDSGIAWEFQRSDEDFTYQDDNGTPLNLTDDQELSRINNGFQRVSLLPWWKRKSGMHQFLIAGVGAFQSSQIPGSVAAPSEMELKQWFSQMTGQYRYGETKYPKIKTEIFYRRTAENLVRTSGASVFRSIDTASDVDASAMGGQLHLQQPVSFGRLHAHFGGRYHHFHRVDEFSEQQLDRVELPASLGMIWTLSPLVSIKPSVLGAYFQDKVSNHSFLSPRLSIEARTFPWLNASIWTGRYFRVPTLTEQGGVGRALTGNPDLQPETALKAGFGLATEPLKVSSQLSLTASYRYGFQSAEGLIVLLPTSRSSWRPTNIGASTIHSHEWSVAARAWKNWQWTQSLIWLEAINQSALSYENGRELPGRHPLRWLSRLFYESARWSFGYDFGWFSRSYLDTANEQVLDSYWRHDVDIAYSTKTLGRWSFEIQNVFNVRTASAEFAGANYQEDLSGLAGYPVSGRRWYLKWTYAF